MSRRDFLKSCDFFCVHFSQTGLAYRSSDEKNQKKRLAFFGFFRGGGQTAGRTRRHYRYIDETSHTVPLANCSKGIEKIRWIFRLFAPLRFCRY